MKQGTKQPLVLVVAPIAVAVIAVTVWAVASAPGKKASADGASEAPTSVATTTTAAVMYSSQCRLAVLDWAGETSKMQADLAFRAPDHATGNRMTPTASRVTVHCPKSLSAKVADIDYRLVLNETRLLTHQKVRDGQVTALGQAIQEVTSLVR